MNCGEEVACKFVVSCSDTPKILQSAEAALDDVAPPVGSLVEAVQGDPVGLVGNDRPRSDAEDQRAERIAIVAFVGEERAHRRCECQHIGRSGNVGVLAWRQMDGAGPAEWIAQRMDFRGTPTARASDRLGMLPPFPPLAERCALIDVESSDNVTASLPPLAIAVKMASHRPAFAQRLKRL